MNKKVFSKIAALAVVMTLATASLVAGTFAKYTTSMAGTDTARVAKFAVEANDQTTSNDAIFELFETINEADGTTAETDVDLDGSGAEKVIAPGTGGSFDIVLENNSEVTVNYEIAFTSVLAGVPLEFSIDGGTTWETNISDLNVAATPIAIGGADVTKTVDWRWPFSVSAPGDAADTVLGLAGTATPTATATVTFTQVD